MSGEMMEGLAAALAEAATDPDARVVVLDGAGPDFCAGADLQELKDAVGGDGATEYGRAFEEALRGIENHPLPVLAAIHGAALGAGCQMTVACDLAVAAEDARIGIPSGRLGVVVSFESVERLVLAVGPKRAADILVAGRTLTGVEARAWGLVNEAVPGEALADRTQAMAERVATSAPLSVRASKRGIRVALDGLALDRQTEGFGVGDFEAMATAALASEDLREGIEAFRERRPPEFRGT